MAFPPFEEMDRVPQVDPFAAILAQQQAQTQAAQQQMQQAQLEYEQANATPAERMNPLAAGFNLGLGRLGTVLAGPGGPNYAGQARAENKSRNDAFIKARMDNLNRLRTTYEAAANRAARIGDQEAETKARIAISKLDKDFRKEEADRKREADKEAADLEFAREKELIGLRGAEARRTNAEKPKSGGADLSDEDVASIGDRLEAGEMGWPQIPREERGRVSRYLDANKKVVLNSKGREAMGKLNAMETALKELQGLSQQVNTAPGLLRAGKGIENTVLGKLQVTDQGRAADEMMRARGQYLPLLARGYGEVGNLAEQEQLRQLAGVPDNFTSKQSAENYFNRAFRTIDALRAKAIKTYTVPMGGMSESGHQTTTSTSTSKKVRVKWTTDANGRPVPVR